MKVRKIPMRTCVVSGEKCEKRDLLRIVRTPLGEVVVDETGKMNGRGAYIKKDISILEKAKKTKALDRKLGCEVKEEIYKTIQTIIEK